MDFVKAGCLLKSTGIRCHCCFHLLFTSVKPENCKNDSKIKQSTHLSLSPLITAHPCHLSKVTEDDMVQGALQLGKHACQAWQQWHHRRLSWGASGFVKLLELFATILKCHFEVS